MTDEQFIKLGLEANLLNYVDNETPRRYFVCGNADLEDVKDFARLVSQEQVKEIERLREALREIVCDCTDECEQSPIGLSPSSDNCYRFVARAALGEGK